MSQPEFIASINARMALETPQVVSAWEFASPASPLDADVPWLWTALRLRRSLHYYPPTYADGDTILTEAYSAAPSTSKADLTVAEDKTYYYSLFFQYPEMDTNALVARLDVRRLYSGVRGMVAAPLRLKVSGADLQTTLVGTTVTSSGSTFRTAGAEAGDWLMISAGPNAGNYSISQVLSETQLLLATPTPNAGTGQSFGVYSDEPRWALAGRTHERREVVFVYNSQTGMVDRALDLSAALAFGEYLTGVLDFDDNVTNENLQVTTNWRYLRFAPPAGGDLPDALTSAEVANQWVLDGKLRGGYTITGSCLFQVYGTGTYHIAILDAVHKEIKVFGEAAGALVQTYALSSLDRTDDLHGLSQDRYGNGTTKTYLLVGNQNYVYAIDDNDLSVTPANVRKVIYVRDLLDGAIAWDATARVMSSIDQVATICNLTGLWDLYTASVGRGYLWQQEYVADAHTVGLWHFTAGAELVDSGPYGNSALNNGMVHLDTGGRFNGGCYQADAAADYLDISAIAGEFDGAEGSASVWFKALSVSQLTVGVKGILTLDADANNRVRIGIEAGGDLFFSYSAGGVTKLCTGAHPSPDTNWHHYKITWSSAGDVLKAYVDGVQFSTTQTGLGTWVGSLAVARVGGDSTNTTLGYYDEVRVSDVPRVVTVTSQVWTDRNTCHSYSGRDPVTRGFNYRDEMWTEKYMGGDWLIRNDYDVNPTPVDQVLTDGELVFRQATKNIGDLGRLSRLLGLFLDRLGDDRDHLITALATVEGADDDYLQDQADRLGIKGLESDWNVDRRRRWVLMMRRVLKQGGIQTSYHRLSALLGYKLTIDTLYSRRWLDSVIDPTRADVYLDDQGSLDTSDLSYPLAILRFRWYRSAFFSTAGVASAGKLLTDAGASFKTTARAGSLVRVYNLANQTNDGDYLVVSVLSNTVLLLDREWANTSLSGMHYSVNWHVPPPDPTAAYLLDRAGYIKPKVFRVEVL